MKLKFCVAALGACLMFSAASAAEVAGVPMKDYHVKAFGGAVQCAVCHETNVPKSRPNDKTCRICHGPMEKIKTPDNPFDKKPHQSAHYADTLECTACHAEHKASKDLCSTCHNVKWTKFQ